MWTNGDPVAERSERVVLGLMARRPASYLAIYLNDHLAASTLLVELVGRGAREHAGTPLGEFLAGLSREVRADRRALRDVMAAVGVQPQLAKVASAWLAEKAGRLKLNGHLLERSPLSPVVELEAIATGIQVNLQLWRALRATVDDAGAPFDVLVARAEAQLAAVEPHRLAAAAQALRRPAPRIAVIGSGHVGGSLTRRLRALGRDVAVANSRGPDSLGDLAAETGARPATAADAARDADVVVLAVPLGAVPDLPADALAGRVVVDANNYYPSRDGQIEEIDAGVPSSRWVDRQLPGATVVKAFNTMPAGNLLTHGRAPGEPGRVALPVAADSPDARRTVMDLVDALGFEPVDAGSLDDSWRQQPDMPVYGAELDGAGLRAGLAAAMPPGRPGRSPRA
jgi:predicted dinucleotide-binding enzyme